jgi:ABC-2 type transport system permease protein
VTCSFLASQAALADAGTVRALLCAVGYLVLTAVLGVALGTITRSSSGALAVVVTVALLVPALAPGLPGALADLAATYWPTTAGQTSSTSGTGPLPALAAHLALTTRDA